MGMKDDRFPNRTQRLNTLESPWNATPGVQLLTTFDDEEAQKYCYFMQSSESERRQSIMHQIIENTPSFKNR